MSAETTDKIRVPAAAFKDMRCFVRHFLDVFLSQGIAATRLSGNRTLGKGAFFVEDL